MHDVRCPGCNRLVCRMGAEHAGRVEIKCTCRRIVVIDGQQVTAKNLRR